MRNYFPGDRVTYIGYKLKSELSSKIGVVVGVVNNQQHAIVVDFGEATYICEESSLRRARVYRESEFNSTKRNKEE